MLIYQLASCRLSSVSEGTVAAIAARVTNAARLIEPARNAQAEVLGVPNSELSSGVVTGATAAFRPFEFIDGEVLSRDREVAALAIRVDRDGVRVNPETGDPLVDEASSATLYCASVSPTASGTLLPDLQKAVLNELGIEMELSSRPNRRFQELLDEGRSPSPEPTTEEVTAARALANELVRRLALGVKASGGLLLSDLASQLGNVDAEQGSAARQTLEDVGLVEADVVVVCSQGGGQVNRLDDRESLQVLAGHGLRCSCGRPIDQETCEDAISISSLGRDLLDGSRWMTVLLVDELKRCGVDPSRVLVEQQTGGDEVDAIADVYGSVALFELKDKVFSLGNAYSFGAKMGIVRPDVPIIVTTANVGNDAKTHFDERRRSARRPTRVRRAQDAEPEVRYIEGIENLRPQLDAITAELAVGRATAIFQDVLALATLSAEDVLATVKVSQGVEADN